MTDMFRTDFFVGNRRHLLEQTDAKLIVLIANGVLQRSADTTFPFRQESNFWYLTGISDADFTLVIQEEASFLIAPKRADHRDLWDGTVDKKVIKNSSGVDEIIEHHEGWLQLDKLLKKHKKVHTIAPFEPYIDVHGFYANPARGTLLSALKKHRNLEIVDIRKNLARMRQVKQAPELSAIKRAISITAETLIDVKNNLPSYTTENEVAADITAGFMRRGAAGHAYQPIVACGENAHTIHYIQNNAPLKPGFLLLDVGAEVNNYSADITRTFAVGQVTARQTAIYESVLRVQEAAYALLKPGIDMKAYEQEVDMVMAKELKKLKLLKDMTDKKKLKKYYPHLTSHFLGLDTHDAADYAAPLPVGAVLTVEPGIYIPEEGIGVRTEDNVLITKDGVRDLSASLPKALVL